MDNINDIIDLHERIFIIILHQGKKPDYHKEFDGFEFKKIFTENGLLKAKARIKNQNKEVKILIVRNDEYSEWIDLWRTYEFSDRFTVISEDTHFGSMLNYVETGLISWNEYFDALLAE